MEPVFPQWWLRYCDDVGSFLSLINQIIIERQIPELDHIIQLHE